MAFLKDWKPVLTNPALEMSQESPTGYKEAYDLGYTLRTRFVFESGWREGRMLTNSQIP
jgi:hypothetical protein